MRAVVLNEGGGPRKLALEEIETPEPVAGEVRVRLEASALNRRDYWITLGKYPGLRLPCIPGSDGAGVVDAVGAGVDAARVGTQVLVYPAFNWGDDPRAYSEEFRILGMPDQGTFAEYICVPEENVYARPQHLDWAQSAAVPLAGLTSWRAAVTHGEVGPGQKVLVTAAGSGVSTFAILWCVHLGADVYVTSGTDAKIQAAVAKGAVYGANYRTDGFCADLKRRSGGFDVIIDSAGGDGVNALLDTLVPAGRYVFFGATLGNPSTGLELRKMFFRHTRIQGTTMGSPAEFRAMLDFVSAKKILPVVDCVLPLDQAVRAHERMADFTQTGKIVLINR